MNDAYIEKQAMKLMWLIAPISIAITVASFIGTGGDKDTLVLIVLLAVLVFALVFVLLGLLTIRITPDDLAWSFGFFSRPSWRVPLSEIAHVELAHSRWIEGWGIKLTREGWLYNAHGFGAVRITKRDGTSFRLGSADPQRLASFLQARISHTSANIR